MGVGPQEQALRYFWEGQKIGRVYRTFALEADELARQELKRPDPCEGCAPFLRAYGRFSGVVQELGTYFAIFYGASSVMGGAPQDVFPNFTQNEDISLGIVVMALTASIRVRLSTLGPRTASLEATVESTERPNR